MSKNSSNYEIQNLTFVKFICMNDWLNSRLEPAPSNNALALEDLYTDYKNWVFSNSEWSENVLDQKTQWYKKLCQILNAKGIAFQTIRTGKGKSLLGVVKVKGA